MADGSEQADKAKAQLARMADALQRQIDRLLLKLNTVKGDEQLESDKDNLANARKVRAQITEALESDLRSVADLASKAAGDAAEAVAAESESGFSFDADASREIEKIVDGQMQEVADAFSKAADEIGEALRLGVSTGADLSGVIEEARAKIGTTFLKAQAAVDSAIMGAGRQTQINDAQAAQDAAGEDIVMLYVGPSDQKTRDWCADMVGKAVRLDDMGGLDNGTDLEAETFGGGYACRHSWTAMLKSEAEAQGIEIIEV
jgi:hypothetical protein